MELLHRVIFEASLGAPDAAADEGLAVAVGQGGAVVVQIALSESRLRACSAERPPCVELEAAAAVDLATSILRELAPNYTRAIEAAERRAALRLVTDGGPDAA